MDSGVEAPVGSNSAASRRQKKFAVDELYSVHDLHFSHSSAMPVPTSATNTYDDSGIDYSDIEAKYVLVASHGLIILIKLSFDRYHVDLEEGFDNILLVDGVPIVDKSKLEKLITKISREFFKKGAPIKTEDIHIPWDDSAGKSKGYVLIGFFCVYVLMAIYQLHLHGVCIK